MIDPLITLQSPPITLLLISDLDYASKRNIFEKNKKEPDTKRRNSENKKVMLLKRKRYIKPDAEGKYPYTGSLDCAMKTLKAGGLHGWM
ncbi:hypothetical protein L1887_30672 [Cichorium endivia]|nr:hypothetical protein L1887_30672 [Cichorium endivia]